MERVFVLSFEQNTSGGSHTRAHHEAATDWTAVATRQNVLTWQLDNLFIKQRRE